MYINSSGTIRNFKSTKPKFIIKISIYFKANIRITIDYDIFIPFWFYTEYRLTTMACDVNYKEFLQTYNDVQEEDGNFHEAKFNIEGDGIGVFGSVVLDTVTVNVIP